MSLKDFANDPRMIDKMIDYSCVFFAGMGADNLIHWYFSDNPGFCLIGLSEIAGAGVAYFVRNKKGPEAGLRNRDSGFQD